MELYAWMIGLLLLLRSTKAVSQPLSSPSDPYDSVMSIGESVLHDIFQTPQSWSNTAFQTGPSSPPRTTIASLPYITQMSIQTVTSSETPVPDGFKPSRDIVSPTSEATSRETEASSTDSRSTHTTPAALGQAVHSVTPNSDSNSDYTDLESKASDYKDIIIAVSVVGAILLLSLCIMTVWVCILRPKRYKTPDDEQPSGKHTSSRESERPPSITDPDAPAFAEKPLQTPESSYPVPFTYNRYYASISSTGDQLVSPLEGPTNTYGELNRTLEPIPDASEDSAPPSPVEMEGNQTWLPWIPRRSSKRAGPPPVPPKVLEFHDSDLGFAGRRSPGYELQPTYKRSLSRQPSYRLLGESQEQHWPLDRWVGC